MSTDKHPAAVTLGRLGGRARSPAKTAANQAKAAARAHVCLCGHVKRDHTRTRQMCRICRHCARFTRV